MPWLTSVVVLFLACTDDDRSGDTLTVGVDVGVEVCTVVDSRVVYIENSEMHFAKLRSHEAVFGVWLDSLEFWAEDSRSLLSRHHSAWLTASAQSKQTVRV